jgi:hypothetical protein
MASILASTLQKTDDYFNISWIYQNYDHSIFTQTVISTGSFVYYNNTVLGIEILIPQQWTTLSGMPAHQATFMLSYSGKSYHVIHVWTIKNDHVYKLSFPR